MKSDVPTALPAPPTTANALGGEASDPNIQVFNHRGPGGGLLMRAIESQQMLKTIIDSIPSADATHEQLKQRRYNLEKYAHVRGDTSMTPYTGRSFGLLVNPHQMYGHALMASNPLERDKQNPNAQKPPQFKFYPEDAQTSRSDPLTARDLEHVTRDGKSIVEHVPEHLDQLIRTQNERKQQGKLALGNWNEVEMLTAPPHAYVGLFHDASAGKSFDESFNPEQTKALAKSWYERTGQSSLKVYSYGHLGGAGKKDSADRTRVGHSGASSLSLLREIRHDPNLGADVPGAQARTPLQVQVPRPTVPPPSPVGLSPQPSQNLPKLNVSVATADVAQPGVGGRETRPLPRIPVSPPTLPRPLPKVPASPPIMPRPLPKIPAATPTTSVSPPELKAKRETNPGAKSVAALRAQFESKK